MVVGSFFRSSAKILVSTHSLLTLTSIGYGMFGEYLMDKKSRKRNEEEVFDANWYQMATDLVIDMYSGKGATARQHQTGVARLSEDVTFEDPAAICYTKEEVEEAFRALHFAHPKCLSPPKLVNVVPMGDTIQLTYSLHQRYAVGINLNVKSLLILDVNLKHLPDLPYYSELEVTRIEERWNAVKPLGFAFYVPRRINGLLSYYITSNILPGKDGKKTKFFITSNSGGR